MESDTSQGVQTLVNNHNCLGEEAYIHSRLLTICWYYRLSDITLGYVSSREKIWYEPHESRVGATKYGVFVDLTYRYQAQVPAYNEWIAREYLHCVQEGIPSPCINEDVIRMNNRCMFTPESIATRSEDEVGSRKWNEERLTTIFNMCRLLLEVEVSL